MESEIVKLIPLAGELTVVVVLLAGIYLLIREVQDLKKTVKEKDAQLKDCIDMHLEDMRDNYKDRQVSSDRFKVFANEMRDIIRNK